MTAPDLATLADQLRAVQRQANALLSLAGWSLTRVEANTETGRLRVWARRDDGREVTLDARPGRATLTCEQAGSEIVPVGRRGDRALVRRLTSTFLGRHVVGEGVRSGLRGLARYLDDNATTPALVGRAALALIAGELAE